MVKPASLLKGFEREVAKAKPNGKKQIIFDPETTGLALVVTAKGKKSYTIMTRSPEGKQKWSQIGDPLVMTVAEARQKAVEAVQRVKQGQEALPPPETPQAAPETFKAVAERYVVEWVDRGGRKGDGIPQAGKREIVRQLKTYLYPRWEGQPFLSIRRRDVAALMSDLAMNNGAVMADRVLATLNKMFNWYRQFDEDYTNPIIPELKKSGSIADRARDRVLSDDEIRAVWKACDEIGTYGAMVKVGLLSAARREKISTMRWDEIKDGVWTLAVVPREKPHAGVLKLPRLALDVIEAQPKVVGNPYVFAGRGKKAYNSHSVGKEKLDALVPTKQWQFHDLRRTAKTLMQRAGVRSDISELVLGHKKSGVEGVYDRYGYEKEKGEALAALASLIERILAGEQNNVVQLGAAR